MGTRLLSTLAFALMVSDSLVSGIKLTSRRFPSCDFVGGQIYCYGGFTSVTSSQTVDDNLYSLNVAQSIGETAESINEKWELVQPSTPFDTESRRIASAIALPDGKQFLLQGGYTKGTKFINQTIIYDTTTNSWKVASPYSEVSRGVRQIYSASAIILPNNLVGFFGGFEQFANTAVQQITASGAAMPYYGPTNITSVGFNTIKMYSPEADSWSAFSPQNNIPRDYYLNSQTATLDPNSGKIYFLGGKYNTPTQEEVKASFKWAYTFNTKSGSWLNETFHGILPTLRIGHTAHLLPNSRDIVLYGGTDGDDESGKALVDYCFTLNLVDNTWTEQSNLNIPSILSGPRFTHASILVNNTLFVLFGKGLDGTLQSSMLLVDVADIANISYTAAFGAAKGTQSDNPSSTGLSKGAVGGIVAGVIVLVLAIVAVILFYIHKKRKAKQIITNGNQNEYSTEEIHVDWDKIDNQYRESEGSPVGWSVTNSPHSANLVETSKKDDFSPVASSSLNPNANDVVKPSIDIADKGYTLNKPDAA